MGSEIKQTLERGYDIVLATNEIRNLTFAKLKEFSGSSNEGGQETPKVSDYKTFPLIQII